TNLGGIDKYLTQVTFVQANGTPKEGTGWEFVELFTARKKGAMRFPCSEVETGFWLAPEEIDAWTARRPEEFAPGFLECWRLWRPVR
ncbi:MAG: hypothetical protein O3A92_09135, partial [Verrucomicrobia bacterium]|nr:hypothetical protein [Verrucomicrobiota bacterium]